MLIETARLRLVPFTVPFIRASLADDRAEAERLIGISLPENWPDDCRRLLELRLSQIERDPQIVEWLLRGIVWKEINHMIGHIGFHDRPGDPDVEKVAPGAVEIGFTVEPDFRRRGIATEAAEALLNWAAATKGVRSCIASIRPDNQASLALTARMGFRKIGHHIDEIDGHEDIFQKILKPH